MTLSGIPFLYSSVMGKPGTPINPGESGFPFDPFSSGCPGTPEKLLLHLGLLLPRVPVNPMITCLRLQVHSPDLESLWALMDFDSRT